MIVIFRTRLSNQLHISAGLQTILTPQFEFVLATVFELHTDDLNRIFQSVNKRRVLHDTYL